MKKNTLAIRRETVRNLGVSTLEKVAGGISRPRNCNFSEHCQSFHCNGSDMVYGCAGGPETDTGAYSNPCTSGGC